MKYMREMSEILLHIVKLCEYDLNYNYIYLFWYRMPEHGVIKLL